MKPTIGVVATAVALFLVCGSHAYAWHQAGHMETAWIAFSRLEPSERQNLVEILRQHPRYKEDFEAVMPDKLSPEERDQWIFTHASIWPDQVRPFHGHGKLVPNPEDKTSYHREEWHFINFPIVLVTARDAKRAQAIKQKAEATVNLRLDPFTRQELEANPKKLLDMNAIQALAYNTAVFRDMAAATGDRAVALCWILHIVGDIHQPCHAAAVFTETIFSPEYGSDRGANRIHYGSSKGQNLHSLWDDAPGRNDKRLFFKLDDMAHDFLADFEADGAAAVATKYPGQWAQESADLAAKSVYTRSIRSDILAADREGVDPDNEQIVTLPDRYEAQAARVSAKRVVEGGFRLGAVLRELLKP
jgi:hypothetical protein